MQGNLNFLRFKDQYFYRISSLLQARKQDFWLLRCQRGSLKAEANIGHPVYQSQFSKSGIPYFLWVSSWLIISPNKMCFLPKSNLRPFLGAHRSLWWPLQFQNKPCKTPIPNAQSKRSPCIITFWCFRCLLHRCTLFCYPLPWPPLPSRSSRCRRRGLGSPWTKLFSPLAPNTSLCASLGPRVGHYMAFWSAVLPRSW